MHTAVSIALSSPQLVVRSPDILSAKNSLTTAEGAIKVVLYSLFNELDLKTLREGKQFFVNVPCYPKIVKCISFY